MAVNLVPSETKKHFKKSGSTYVNAIHIQYTWKIHNFSLSPSQVGDALKSPTFSAAQNEYNFQLTAYPNSAVDNNKGWLALQLHFVPGKKSEVEAKCKVDILFQDGKTQYFSMDYSELTKFNKEKSLIFDDQRFIERSDVFINTTDILRDDILTIVCDIIILEGITDSANEKNSEVSKAAVCHRLQNDLSDLFESPKFCDVTLIMIKCGQEIQTHKAILAARSPVFAAMFNHGMKEEQENQVNITDVDYDVMNEMLRYVYTGQIPNLDKMAEGLLMAADKYELQTLKDQCENVLCDRIAVENAANLLLLGDLHSAIRLKTEVLDFICKHTKDVLKTTGYQLLRETHPHLIYETVEALAN